MRVTYFLASVVILFAVILVGLSHAEIDPETVMGIWLFDEDKGDMARDSSGNGHDGELIGGPEWVEGKFGSALEFNGNWVEVLDSPELNPETTLTITVWVKPISFPGYSPVINKEWAAPKRQYSFGYPADKTMGMWFDNQGGTEDSIRATTAFDSDTWYFAAVTFDEGNVQMFINGELENSKASGTVTALRTEDTENLTFGSEKGNRSLNGAIDEVAIFNAILTADDIKGIMENGLDGVIAVSAAGKLATTWAEIKTLD